MKVSSQRRLAAQILKVGENRVWIDPNRLDDISMAIRRDDIRRLIHEGAIRQLPIKGISRARAKELSEKRKRGLRSGPGSRKGKRTAKVSGKGRWMIKIRAIRRHLKKLRARRIIRPRDYRRLYRLAKGGVFPSKRRVDNYIQEHKMKRR
ncbi:MAG: 50S ribosomal protein L19e [Candidatus Hermodarchaeia archaeon]|jgi:large subunit ribosomal protein L19e